MPALYKIREWVIASYDIQIAPEALIRYIESNEEKITNDLKCCCKHPTEWRTNLKRLISQYVDEFIDIFDAEYGALGDENIDTHWPPLCENPNAIQLLEDNQDKIDWWVLSSNPNAIHLLEANPNEIDWEYLSTNPNAIHLLEANMDDIDWEGLSMNSSTY